MKLYLMDKDSFRIKDIISITDPDFKMDIDFDDSSTCVSADYLLAQDGDFVLVKDDDGTALFFGIVKETSPSDTGTTWTLKQAEQLFSTTLYTDNQDMIASAGLEDYVVQTIKDSFSASGDTLLDMDFIEASASTHTPVNAKISSIVTTESGTFNFKTFLGNCREYYNLFLDFTPDNGKLYIDVNVKDDAETLKVDTRLAEIMELEETYSVDVLAKLIVKWALEEGGDVTTRTYYLRSDRSITTDINDPLRVDGTVSTKYIQAETEEEMYEQVSNEFTSNSYKHSISFKIKDSSKLFNTKTDFYIGRPVTVLSEDHGVSDSIVTKTERTDESYLSVTFGKLPVTLTEKIRKDVQ